MSGKSPIQFKEGTYLWNVYNGKVYIAGDTTRKVCKMYNTYLKQWQDYNNSNNPHFEEFIVKPEILLIL